MLVRFLRTVGICVFIVWTDFGVPRREIFQVRPHCFISSVRPHDGMLAICELHNHQIYRVESVNFHDGLGGTLYFSAGVQVHAVIEAIFKGGVAVTKNFRESAAECVVAPDCWTAASDTTGRHRTSASSHCAETADVPLKPTF